MDRQRTLVVLGLVAVACGQSKRELPASPDAGSPSLVVDAAGRCDPRPAMNSGQHCAGAGAQVLSSGDGDDVPLEAPNDPVDRTYLFSFDDTCGDERWTIGACAEPGVPPCVWIDSGGRNGELCGEYQDRAGTIWTLTGIRDGLPAERWQGSASGKPPFTDLYVHGELWAEFESGSGDSLTLVLSLNVCGPILTQCCLC